MKRNTFIGGLLALAFAGSVTGVAVAAIPDSTDQEYHVCLPNSGSQKVPFFIDKEAGTSCLPGYTEKVWNQTGPQGPQGPQGTPGNSVVTGYQLISHDNNLNSGSYPYDKTLECPSGKLPISGFGYVSQADGPPNPNGNVPLSSVIVIGLGNEVGGEAKGRFYLESDPFPGNTVDQVHFRMICINATS